VASAVGFAKAEGPIGRLGKAGAEVLPAALHFSPNRFPQPVIAGDISAQRPSRRGPRPARILLRFGYLLTCAAAVEYYCYAMMLFGR
jgi:hypothetical protein